MVSALGMGCWAIGGPIARQGSPVGWGASTMTESMRALRRAFDLGVTSSTPPTSTAADTARSSSRGARRRSRDEIVIATKAGYTYVEETREAPGENGDPDYIRWACDESPPAARDGPHRPVPVPPGRVSLGEGGRRTGGVRGTRCRRQGPGDRVEHGQSGAGGVVREESRTARRSSRRSTCSAATTRCWTVCESERPREHRARSARHGHADRESSTQDSSSRRMTYGTAGTSAPASRPSRCAGSRPSATYLRPTAAPWPRVPWPGSGPAARS